MSIPETIKNEIKDQIRNSSLVESQESRSIDNMFWTTNAFVLETEDENLYEFKVGDKVILGSVESSSGEGEDLLIINASDDDNSVAIAVNSESIARALTGGEYLESDENFSGVKLGEESYSKIADYLVEGTLNTDEAIRLVLSEAFKRVKVIRDGKAVWKNVRVSGRAKRVSAATRQKMSRAAKKAGRSSATKMKRAKSMKKRASSGLKSRKKLAASQDFSDLILVRDSLNFKDHPEYFVSSAKSMLDDASINYENVASVETRGRTWLVVECTSGVDDRSSHIRESARILNKLTAQNPQAVSDRIIAVEI